MTTQISETNIQAATLAALSPVTITSITVTNSSWTPLDDSAVSTSGGYIVITGANFASGCNVIISSTNATSVTFVNSTTLRVQVPAMSAGTYVVYVVNTNGSTAIIVNGLTYSGTPTWVTTSPLPQGTTGVAISIQLSATGDAPLTYVLQAGSSLPAGLTLSSSGLLSGTVSGLTSETTYNFTIEAIDAQSQESPKAFAITIIAGDQYWDYVSLLLPGTTSTSIFNDDASTNNYNITITGDTRPSNLGPYTPGYYSNFFDGSGDYLRVSSTGSGFSSLNVFTYECWIYPTAALSTNCIFDISESTPFRFVLSSTNVNWQGPGGGTILTANFTWVLGAWHHVAFVDDGTNISIFINGTRYATTTYGSWGSTGANGVNIGCNRGDTWFFPGYISNARFVKGTAIYDPTQTTITVPSTPLTAVSGTSLLTCQSNRFIDNSADNLTVTRNGDVTVNSFDPFVPSSSYASIGSTYFDGTGDYLSAPNNSAFAFGTGDFTLECWIYVSSPSDTPIYEGRTSGDSSLGFTLTAYSSTVIRIFCGSALISATVANYTNQWTHVAVVKNSGTTTLYVNGVSGGTTASLGNLTDAQPLIGAGRYTSSASPSAYMLGYISNFRIVKGTAVYTSAFTPSATPLTAIANTSLLTCQTNQSVDNSDFLDSGTNNVVITRNGNTTQGTFSPYAENWSNYFDGTGDYIDVINSSTCSNFGTNNITIEGWYYFTQVTGTQQILYDFRVSPSDVAGALAWTGSSLGWYVSGSYRISGGSVVTNTWYHIALVRESGNTKLYLNGTQVGSTYVDSNNYVGNTNRPRIGYLGDGTGTLPFFGYMSNLRIVKGTALYTTTFTPSTTPLQPIANTSLLTCRDSGIVDDSANRFTITRNGDVTVQKFGPFAGTTLPTPYYGAYFDGSGDYLTSPANFNTGSTWTIEAWCYFTDSAASEVIVNGLPNDRLYAQYIGTTFYLGDAIVNNITISNAKPLNRWVHMAIVKNGGTYTVYQDGVSIGTSSSALTTATITSWQIGARTSQNISLKGYMSNLRIVNGTAVYTGAFTPPTSPLTAVAGTSLLTCQSATFVDNSTNNYAITVNGNSQPTIYNPFTVTYSTMQSYSPSVFGGSMYFDGNGDYLTYPNSSLFAFGTGSFTIEFWINGPLNNDKFILGGRAAIGTMHITTGGFSSTAGVLRYVGSATIVSSNVITDNTWHHCAIVRNGSTAITLYVDGVAVGTGSDSTNYTTTSGTWHLGKNDSGDTGYLNGYISDLRVIRGQALYTSNFVPSNIPLTAVQNTVLLLNGTAGGIIDVSSNNDFETVADAKLSVVQSKWSSTGMYFDGTGDWLLSPHSANQMLGTGNFTVECWLYLGATGSSRGVVGKGTATTGWLLSTNTSNNVVFTYASSTITSSGALAGSTWYHIAVVRQGTGANQTKIYINGTNDGTGTVSTDFNQTNNMYIGANRTGGDALNGYMNDLRITNGYARYTTNFSVPTSPFITN